MIDDLEQRAELVQEELLAPLNAAERAQLQALLAKVLAPHPDLGA